VKSTTAPPLKGSTTASPWVALWRIIERIASAIGDSREPEHYARARLDIRQAALAGRLRIRGRHEIEIAGQDRTNFSDVYTEIPPAYWKYSVINVLATGPTCEAERHTQPETVYAWGPKGLHETNCYAGLQLNSEDVSELIGDVRGTCLPPPAPTSEKEDWISAASAVALLGMEYFLGTRTICKRAHAGLIKARAERFISDGRSDDNIDVPVEFCIWGMNVGGIPFSGSSNGFWVVAGLVRPASPAGLITEFFRALNEEILEMRRDSIRVSRSALPAGISPRTSRSRWPVGAGRRSDRSRKVRSIAVPSRRCRRCGE
jgi:hypothetical protein